MLELATAKQTPSTITFLPLLLQLTTTFIGVEVEGANTAKLFVFGDSYVDMGNVLNFRSYKPAYGVTFPGKPTGRFSDGGVLTDYVASFLKIKSPVPFALRNSSEVQYEGDAEELSCQLIQGLQPFQQPVVQAHKRGNMDA